MVRAVQDTCSLSLSTSVASCKRDHKPLMPLKQSPVWRDFFFIDDQFSAGFTVKHFVPIIHFGLNYPYSHGYK